MMKKLTIVSIAVTAAFCMPGPVYAVTIADFDANSADSAAPLDPQIAPSGEIVSFNVGSNFLAQNPNFAGKQLEMQINGNGAFYAFLVLGKNSPAALAIQNNNVLEWDF